MAGHRALEGVCESELELETKFVDLPAIGAQLLSEASHGSQNQRDLVAMQTSAKDVRQRFDQHDAVVLTIGGGEGAVTQR
jgi:hypothetical protein